MDYLLGVWKYQLTNDQSKAGSAMSPTQNNIAQARVWRISKPSVSKSGLPCMSPITPNRIIVGDNRRLFMFSESAIGFTQQALRFNKATRITLFLAGEQWAVG
jgi:hypothetical protein